MLTNHVSNNSYVSMTTAGLLKKTVLVLLFSHLTLSTYFKIKFNPGDSIFNFYGHAHTGSDEDIIDD